MVTMTGTLTVNAAFLQEIKADNWRLQELLANLHDLTEDAAAHIDREQIVKLLQELCDQLEFHFTLEEVYGYFEEAVDVAPHVAERADDLRAEHRDLFESVLSLADAAERWHSRLRRYTAESARVPAGEADRDPLFEQILIQFWQFEEQLKRHEQNESALILDAFATDIGGEG